MNHRNKSGFQRYLLAVVGSGLLFGTVCGADAAINIASLSPANGATNICTDTPLRITFDSAPNYGSVLVNNSERITIYAQDGTVVDVIDMILNVNKVGSTNVQTRFISATNGSVNSFFAFPIIVSGNTATIYPHNVALTNGQTYYINITSQLFTNSANGAFGGINDSNTWSFTTKPAKPPTGTNELNVAADGSGDYCTLQGALDFLPANTGQHIQINVRNGIYEEIAWVNAKTNITIRGENRKNTLLRYRNNENLNSGSTKRCLLFVSGDGFAIENMTVTNSTPKGGSQAEALRMAGRRFVANNCDFDSFQDTILVNSSARFAYFYNCLVQGDVDFIWNDASVVFQDCEIKSLSSGGYVCQMRTPDVSHHGAVFLDCTFTKAAGISGCYFNRIATADGPASEVALVNCRMDTHIIAAGWLQNGAGATNDFRFKEYLSSNLTATAAINVSGRAAFSSQITEAEAKAYRNLTNFYAINLQWLPQLAPNIITNPTSQSVSLGGNVTFNAAATGIETTNPATLGDPSIIVPLSYQWLKNGTNLDGATSASLTINTVAGADGGTYALVASNLTGTAVSTNVTLTVIGGNTVSVFAGVSDQTVNVGVTVLVTNTATDSDLPAQTLTYSLLSAPGSATLDTNTAVFTWRPTVAFSDTTNPVSVVVTDDGTPILTATQSFNVVVNPLTAATVSNLTWSAGQFGLTVNGQTGPDYALLTSTNLTNWSTLLITNSPAMPFNFIDNTVSGSPIRFYRIKAGPPLP